jgi:hypothetical protein
MRISANRYSRENGRSPGRGSAALLAMGLGVWLLLANMPLAQADLSLLDQQLDEVRGNGLYFRVDLNMEVFDASSSAPTVLLNTDNTTLPIPTTGTGTGATSTTTSLNGAGSVSLSGSAQSNVSALVNVIGAGSVINVGINVISISSSTGDTIYTTNYNQGILGGFVTPAAP